MSISIEALAMIGRDYINDGISMEEYEEHEAQVPPHLLVDDDQEKENFFAMKKNIHQENYEYYSSCEKDEVEQKKTSIIRKNVFMEFLKKKNVANFLRLVGIIIV